MGIWHSPAKTIDISSRGSDGAAGTGTPLPQDCMIWCISSTYSVYIGTFTVSGATPPVIVPLIYILPFSLTIVKELFILPIFISIVFPTAATPLILNEPFKFKFVITDLVSKLYKIWSYISFACTDGSEYFIKSFLDRILLLTYSIFLLINSDSPYKILKSISLAIRSVSTTIELWSTSCVSANVFW